MSPPDSVSGNASAALTGLNKTPVSNYSDSLVRHTSLLVISTSLALTSVFKIAASDPLGRNPNHLLEITMAALELGTALPTSRTPHHTITSNAGIPTSINISRIPNHTPKSSSRPHTLVSQSRKTLSLFVFLSAIGSVSYVNICEMCNVLPPSSSNMFF